MLYHFALHNVSYSMSCSLFLRTFQDSIKGEGSNFANKLIRIGRATPVIQLISCYQLWEVYKSEKCIHLIACVCVYMCVFFAAEWKSFDRWKIDVIILNVHDRSTIRFMTDGSISYYYGYFHSLCAVLFTVCDSLLEPIPLRPQLLITSEAAVP